MSRAVGVHCAQMAKDVCVFLAWASEPEHDDRKVRVATCNDDVITIVMRLRVRVRVHAEAGLEVVHCNCDDVCVCWFLQALPLGTNQGTQGHIPLVWPCGVVTGMCGSLCARVCECVCGDRSYCLSMPLKQHITNTTINSHTIHFYMTYQDVFASFVMSRLRVYGQRQHDVNPLHMAKQQSVMPRAMAPTQSPSPRTIEPIQLPIDRNTPPTQLPIAEKQPPIVTKEL